MKHMRQFNEYLKMDIRSLFFYIIGTVILISTYLICHANNIPLALLFRDPSSSGGLPFYAGWISYLGVAIWAAGSSIILFTSHFLKNTIRSKLLLPLLPMKEVSFHKILLSSFRRESPPFSSGL